MVVEELNPRPELVANIRGVLKVFRDGSFTRTQSATVPPSPQGLQAEDAGVATKDVALDPDLGLWVRLYLPPHNARMPVCLYFHGGGFGIGSSAWPMFHNFSIRMAAAAGALLISVNYRLAPEHPLPAAYDDCSTVLSWLRSQSLKQSNGGGADPWFESHADFSKVFLAGDSAGANIIHNLCMRGAALNPLPIRGALMLQPFFGGEARTRSEIESPEDLERGDAYWRLALPVGGNRDHPFSNPIGPESPNLSEATFPPLILFVGGRDMLRDRHREYYHALHKCGKQIEMIVLEEEDHGFYALKPNAKSSETLFLRIADFIKFHSESLP